MMEHKAFLFAYEPFDAELRPLLEDDLRNHNYRKVRAFALANLDTPRDPYEGEPLRADWESLIETRDTHQYGDFALTKYYDPIADIGLGQSWEGLQELIEGEVPRSPLLGSTIGPIGEPFDPGKMGSYFQNPGDVTRNYKHL